VSLLPKQQPSTQPGKALLARLCACCEALSLQLHEVHWELRLVRPGAGSGHSLPGAARLSLCMECLCLKAELIVQPNKRLRGLGVRPHKLGGELPLSCFPLLQLHSYPSDVAGGWLFLLFFSISTAVATIATTIAIVNKTFAHLFPLVLMCVGVHANCFGVFS